MKASLFAILAYAGAASASFACGPDFPPEYLHGPENPYFPRMNLESEFAVIAAETGALPWKGPSFKAPELSSLEADRKDFKEALGAIPGLDEAKRRDLGENYTLAAKAARAGKGFDFKEPSPKLKEFALYLKGWAELSASNGETGIPASWKELLALPPGERRYRTVWTHYMIGNMMSSQWRMPEARKHYGLCRKAASDGFADSNGLAYVSYLRQLRSEKQPVEKCKAAIEAWSFYKAAKDAKRAEESLRRFQEVSLGSPEDLETAMSDPLAREACSALLMVKDPETLLKALRGRKVANGERAAYAAYRSCQDELARKWLDATPDSSLLKHWIAGKLLRREGKYPEAAVEFRRWLEIAQKLPQDAPQTTRLTLTEWPSEWEPRETINAKADVNGSLGFVLVETRDFLDALHCFMLANSWTDAAYVAERLLPSEALAKYVDANCPAKPDWEPQSWHLWPPENNSMLLRHLLARRLAREGDFAKAAIYMPESLKTRLQDFAFELNASGDSRRGDDHRALHLFNAAKIMKISGMELFGTELAPDLALYNGSYHKCEIGDPSKGRLAVVLDPGIIFIAKAHAPSPDRWLHYKFKAVDMAVEAASLAYSKEMKAIAFYSAGLWLSAGVYPTKEDMRKADELYKRLVRECRPAPLALRCDENRWFLNEQGSPVFSSLKDPKPIKSLEEIEAIANAMPKR